MSDFENEKNKSEFSLNAHKVRTNNTRKEISADFVLPDYMGDIKRILKYNAYVTPCNKLISSEEASFIAIVTFRVLYIDSEDMLTEANFSQDCEFSEKLFADSSDADVNYKIQSVAIKLGGPRKIGAKAIVNCESSLVEAEEIHGYSEYDGAEVLKKEIEVHTVEYLKCSEREYAEEIDKIEEITSDDLEIIKSYAEAFIDGIHKTDDGVNLSGYADAFCLLRGDDGIIRLEKRIPIEEHIECITYDESAFTPKAFVTGVTVNLNNVNSDAECAVSVVMNMTVECCLAHHYNEKVVVVEDAFFKGCKNECSYETFEYSSLGSCVTDKAPCAVNIERGEEPLHDIIERELTLKNMRYDRTGTDVTLMCDAEIHMVARGNDNESCYTIKENFEFSKRYRLETDENTNITINAIPCDVSVSFDSEKIYVEGQILVSILTQKSKSAQMLTNVEYETLEDESCSVIVYYPEKKDTLWSVSKKYGVSPSSVASRNEISNNELSECKKIIIVK